MSDTPETDRAIEQLRRTGAMTAHDWLVLDQAMQQAALKAAASLLRRRSKAIPERAVRQARHM